MSSDKKRVLVVAAHPDDEVLGCGATIARFARAGDDCHILIMAEGMTSRENRERGRWGPELNSLHRCAREAGMLLGAASVEVGNLPDNRMDTVALLDVVKIVEAKIAAFRPQVIFTHHSGDLNIDHAVTSRAVETATRPQGLASVAEVLAFETLSATEWSFARQADSFRPNYFIAVKETLELKVAAMRIYSSELRAFPHPRSIEGIEALARFRGAQSGHEAAEAFTLVRAIL